jgi:hypothetical protein
MFMDRPIGKKNKNPGRLLAIVSLLLISGAAVGIALALGFSRLFADACPGAPSCQKPFMTLFGGIVTLHVVNIVAVFALVAHLNRKSQERMLDALRP